MYTKPKLQRFGTLRDLTRTGAGAPIDGHAVIGEFPVRLS